MIFYGIRHKESGDLMPQLRRKGYTYWKANVEMFAQGVGHPRLFLDKKKAEKVIVEWAKGIYQWEEQPPLEEEEVDVLNAKLGFPGYKVGHIPPAIQRPVNDGRNKGQLEVVQFNLEVV